MIETMMVSEKKMLRKIQWRLVMWLVTAFVLFGTGLAAGTFYVLKNQLMYQNQVTLEQGWETRTNEALDLLTYDHHDHHFPSSDQAPHELDAVWVVNSEGQVLRTGLSPVSDTSIITRLILHAGTSLSHQKNVNFFTTRIGDTTVLIGAMPLFKNQHYVGYLASASSLAGMTKTLHELYLIDLYFGVISLLAIVLITRILSGRALIPIRNALARQRNFVNDAAHELRTPLAILRGTLELTLGEDHLPVIRGALQDGLDEVDYLSSLVGNLSTLARMESGTLDMDWQTVDLYEIAKTVIAALTALGEMTKVRLLIESSGSAKLQGDPVRLRQLLVILLENAIKYNVENGQVRVSIQPQSQGWQLIVEDTGVGIPLADLPHIFDRFFRSIKTASYQEGSGIGLAIAAWIIDRHRGKVTVQSELGTGTTFKVWLPAHK